MKKIQKFLSLLLIWVLLLSTCVFQALAVDGENCHPDDDPIVWKMEQQNDTYNNELSKEMIKKTKEPGSSFEGYTHNPYFEALEIRNGIDVSDWNEEIDWSAVKEDGIDFAIIRVAWRGYGSAGNMVPDDYYKENIAGALAAGIDVGVYFFSQATTTSEAVAEANFLMKCLNDLYDDPNYDVSKNDITLPAVIDFEYAGSPGRLRAANLSVNAATNVVMTFCNTVEKAGYEGMVYANLNMFENDLNVSKISEKYKIWLAQYYYMAELDGPYDFWQFRSDGTISGIPTEVDCDFWYIFSPFNDVKNSHWFYKNVQYVYENGYMQGISAKTFGPNMTLTREMVATILYSIAGYPEVSFNPSLNDVEAGKWYSLSISWAYQNGITAGYDTGNFGVGDAVTREQLATMLYCFAASCGADTSAEMDLSGYSDKDTISSWAIPALSWSVKNGIISGRTAETLAPRGFATRAECATMIRNFVENILSIES